MAVVDWCYPYPAHVPLLSEGLPTLYSANVVVDFDSDGSICVYRSVIICHIYPVRYNVGLVAWMESKGDQCVSSLLTFPRVPYYNPAYESPSCETRIACTDRRGDT